MFTIPAFVEPGPPSVAGHTTLVRRRLALDVGEAPDGLMRVLTLLRRRQCRIVAVAFQHADRHGPGRLDLTVLAPRRTAHRLEAWLLGLVEVRAVGEAGARTEAKSPAAYVRSPPPPGRTRRGRPAPSSGPAGEAGSSRRTPR